LSAVPTERLELTVHGQVQGVGFRPYVYRLARELGLTGWVLNNGQGVRIQIQGGGAHLDRFVRSVRKGPASMARVDAVNVASVSPQRENGFYIRASSRGVVGTNVAPDTAVCSDCLQELFDATDRRYRYPFINCTHCGPRFTITEALPYDRESTSMKAFELCQDCSTEYGAPCDRRFHAEANACPVCGPKLTLLDGGGKTVAVDDPITATLERLTGGEVVALKGLGGFHLACDARSAIGVARLRERKRRAAKPFAVMALNAESIRTFGRLDEEGRRLLESPERPIVLLDKLDECDSALVGVAPALSCLGVMLPYTPLHYLLFHESLGRPRDMDWLEHRSSFLLVMTSANPGGEPLVIDNDEAIEQLAGIADGFLVHDRDILERCDDSVVRPGPVAAVKVRRARGFTPSAVKLPASGPSVLALGGWLKNTVCVTRDDLAYLSAHVGDLDTRATRHAMERAVTHLLGVLEITPAVVAHDLHPDFPSSHFALEYARRHELPTVAVQHHHAHIAAVAAEHGLREPILGLALDGVGLGTDGTAWGGELLEVEQGFRRLGHLLPLSLPGGDRAAREPWRMAASVLHALGRGDEIEHRFPGEMGSPLREMLDRGTHCPRTTSTGRLFDAAAALLGVRNHNGYDAQAAMHRQVIDRTKSACNLSQQATGSAPNQCSHGRR